MHDHDKAFGLTLIEYLMTGCPVRPLRVSPLFERTQELSPWLRDPPPTARRKQQHHNEQIHAVMKLFCVNYTKLNY